MASNGYRRKAAKAPPLASVNEIMGQGGRTRPGGSLESVQTIMRQGSGNKPVARSVPSIPTVLRQGGGKS
jgi:hypothetical protein